MKSTIQQNEPLVFQISLHFLLRSILVYASCSDANLPLFLYCKQRKAGQGLGMRLTTAQSTKVTDPLKHAILQLCFEYQGDVIYEQVEAKGEIRRIKHEQFIGNCRLYDNKLQIS